MNPSLWNQSMLGPAATMPTTVDPDIANETIPMAVSTVNIVPGENTRETLTPDGVTLTLSSVPLANFMLFKNGLLLTEDVDYTILEDEVTLLVAPDPEDLFVADYLE